MNTNTTSGAADLALRLRNACTSVRSKSYPLADLIPLMQQAADVLASTPARAAEPSITLDFKMATDLLGMFCGEPGLVTLQRGDEHCHSGPGLYAWYSDMPEEGAGFLGAEPDDEATPSAPSAPAQPVADPAKSASHGQAPAGATPECLTCSDHGAVGNILTAEPCPDCTRWNVQPALATQQAVDAARKQGEKQ